MITYLRELQHGHIVKGHRATTQAWILRALHPKKMKKRNGRKGPVREWRMAVLQRAGHTCLVCGDMNRLEAHHIEGWRNNPSVRFDVDNGVCLCRKCHKRFHKMFGNYNNTEKHWRIFYDEGVWLR